MTLSVRTTLRAHIMTTLTQLYGLDSNTLPSVVIEHPPDRSMGDLAVTVAFELARVLRKPPRVIAQELVDALGKIEGIYKTSAVPNGYINFYLDRITFITDRLSELRIKDRNTDVISHPNSKSLHHNKHEKTIVEHTAINPNKAAHIGHLRNAILGDTLVRILRFLGTPVETQNYIDDTGVQVADIVVGFRELESKSSNDIRKLAKESQFDYYCWDLYAKVTKWYEDDKTRLKLRSKTLKDLENGNNETAEIAQFVADQIVRRHLQTMSRMNIGYDLLIWEGDILRLRFWARAFEILKKAGAITLETKGKLAGCWVMVIDDNNEKGKDLKNHPPADNNLNDSPTENTLAETERNNIESRSKVIVRSDGTVTYVGKDIAYQFWKFGLLNKDFYYQIFNRQANDRELWSTSSHPITGAFDQKPPVFGSAQTVYNVIDTRQTYLQKLLQQALHATQHKRQADQSIHFSYEMVALSKSTALALGYNSTQNSERTFVEVSGRKGLGVKADDLLDRLIDLTIAEVTKRNPDLSQEARRQIAEMIGIAAVRYFMIKYSRGKIIAFDIEEALSFEGESGPYLQYAVVRANNILRKLHDHGGIGEVDIINLLASTPTTCIESKEEGNELWSLILEASRLDEIAEQATKMLELSILAKYAFSLAQSFNTIYHRYPVLNEERKDFQLWRAATVSYFRFQMTKALHLIGCEAPPRM